MEDPSDTSMDIFTQDGVYLTNAPANYLSYCNSSGTLIITEYLNSNKARFIEWKPNDVTIDSDVQDQEEWAVVNTVERRTRTTSGASDSNRSKTIKISFADIKSFKVEKHNQKLTFYDGKSEPLISFFFQHGSCTNLVGTLKGLFRTSPAKRNKNLYIIDDFDNNDSHRLTKSFAELNLFPDEPARGWKFLSNFHNSPYEATMEAFSKITTYVYRGPEEGGRILDEDVRELLNRSMSEIENNTTTQVHGDYEVIAHTPKLPTRKEFPRGSPLTSEQWKCLQDFEGRIEDIEAVKLVIFRGGIAPNMRKEVWKYLLNFYPWESTHIQRQSLIKQKSDEYFIMKLQWRSMTKAQEDNFADYRERKSLIEKDVNRTDRTLDFYAGDNNPNLQTLSDILMTYVMYNFDLGYVQGMSDLLSPILHLMENEVDAFWCFVGFMNKVCQNFDIDQHGMKEQLIQLHTLVSFVDPKLADYLDKHDSGNMFFCFRWLLVWFKRELSQDDIMRLWEVMWTGMPCKNFHLIICVAILDTEKEELMGNDYGFTEILKHINELSGQLDISSILNKAEGIYYQIIDASHLTNRVRAILGIPIPVDAIVDSTDSPIDVANDDNSLETVNIGPDEVAYERAINGSFM